MTHTLLHDFAWTKVTYIQCKYNIATVFYTAFTFLQIMMFENFYKCLLTENIELIGVFRTYLCLSSTVG